jgi:hypothetical protein
MSLPAVELTAADSPAAPIGAGRWQRCWPLDFAGFLPPLTNGVTETGAPLAPARTFRLGCVIPVRFRAFRRGAPEQSGPHLLRLVKCSGRTVGGQPLHIGDAGTPTAGDEFVLENDVWCYRLDTIAAGMSQGVWQIVAALSDGSRHGVWVQLK